MGRERPSRRAARLAALLLAGTALSSTAARAIDATWKTAPLSNNFNADGNWNPDQVPTGTATFGTSTKTDLTFSADTTIGGWTFNAGASNYTFHTANSLQTLTFNGGGIVINGGSASITGSSIKFNGSSTAGSATIFINPFGILAFSNNSTAGSAAITNNAFSSINFNNNGTAGSASISNGGRLTFNDNSTAGSAAITNNTLFGVTTFNNNSTAGSAAITNNNFGSTIFNDNSTAGSASITNNSGEIVFNNNSTAGGATITNSGSIIFANNSTAGSASISNNAANAIVDFSSSTGPAGDGKLSAGSIAGSGNFYLGADQLTLGGNNQSTTVSGVISDCGQGGTACDKPGATGGSLVKTGTGTLTLTGLNTYTGGTTVQSGNLQIGDTGLDGRILGAVAVNNNGRVDFVDSNMAGVTTIALNDSSTLVLRGTTHAGTASIDIGTNANMALFGASAGNATITNNGGLSFGFGATAGNAVIDSTNEMSFVVGSSAGNAGITQSGGRIQVLDTSTLGNATVNGINGALIEFGGNATAGSAALTANSGAEFDFSNTSGPAGDHRVSAGSIAGSGFFTLGANNLTFGSLNTNTEVSGAVSGDGGSLTKVGTGTTILSGANTYTGGTTISAGTLQLGNGGTTGSIVGNVTDNGTFAFNRSNTLTLDSVISGTGAVQQNGTGTTILTATNTYTGGTTIAAGTLQLGNGGTTGSIVGNVTDNGILAFDRSDDIAFGGVISGSGGVQQDGTGSLTLTGTNTYTGATAVNSGALYVTGALAGTSGVTVANGALLGGTGTIGSTTVQSGGTLLPGFIGTPGTLTISGNLMVDNGAFYVVHALADSTFAKTNVSGSTTLNGGDVFVQFADGKYKPGKYAIVTANGGLSGQFAELFTLGIISGVRNPHLAYDANDVFLVLDPTTISILSSFTANQQAVATGINNAIVGGANPNDSFNALLNLTGAQLTDALTQLEGTTPGGATTAAMQLMNGFLSLLLHPNGGAPQGLPGAFGGGPSNYAAEAGFPRDVAEAYAAAMPVKAAPAAQSAFASRWSTWAAAYGGATRIGGQAGVGTADTKAQAYAVAGGAEYRLLPQTTIGFALAGGGTSWGLSQGLGTGAGDAFQIGGYATHNFGAAYLAGAIAYAWHDMHTDRTVTVAGTEQLHAGFRAQGFGGRIEGGYRLANAWVNVTPYGALQVQTFRTPSYSEVAQSGLGAFALSYASRSTTATRTELGAWFDKPFVLGPDRLLSLKGRLAWAHDHSTDPTLNALFQTLPGSSFAVNTTAAPADLALVSAGAELTFARNWSIGAKFDGEFSSRSESYAGTGTIKVTW